MQMVSLASSLTLRPDGGCSCLGKPRPGEQSGSQPGQVQSAVPPEPRQQIWPDLGGLQGILELWPSSPACGPHDPASQH